MILRNRHRPEIGAVHKAHQREFLTLKEILDNHLRAGVAEAVVHENVLQSGDGGLLIHRHGHALACGQAIGLDDDRRAMLAHISGGTLQIVERLVLRGRNVVTFHKLLGEVLGTLDLRGGLVRAERLDAGGREIVDDAFDKRHFRSDEHPVVTIVLHEIDERRMIGRVELRGADAVKLHARIAWGHSDLADVAATHERVGDGMFTRTGTNDQNLHISSCCIPYGEECQSQEIISGVPVRLPPYVRLLQFDVLAGLLDDIAQHIAGLAIGL